jgi:ADP-ribose pyrophosphatase
MVKPWKRVEPTVVAKVDRRPVVLKTFIQPEVDGPRVFATMLAEDSRAAAVIAITDDNRVVVARQFRPGPEKIMDELPGGGVNPGEDPQAGAIRELAEETGYIPGEVTFLGTSSRDAYTNGTWYYYLATGCRLSGKGQELDVEDNEQVDVQLISIEQLLDNAKQDRMTDPHAVLMAYDTLRELQRSEEKN